MPSNRILQLAGASSAGARADLTEVALRGEIDAASADRLVDDLRAAMTGSARLLRADLSAVTFMDASGVRACLQAQQSARALGWNLVFVEPRGIVARLIELLELDRALLGEPALA